MTFDQDSYRREVIEPARTGGGALPEDLFDRYALREDAPEFRSDTAFEDHVAAVVKYWRSLRQQRVDAALADRLLAAHAELSRNGDLERARFVQRRRKARDRLQQRIAQRVGGVEAAFTCVSPEAVRRLAASLGGVSEPVALAALRQRGVRVAQPVPLPARPPSKYRDLQRHLDVLSLRLSADVVFGEQAVRQGFSVLHGFRLATGARLDDQAIQHARAQLSTRRDDATTAAQNVLAILQAEARKPGGLEELVLWEVVGALQPAAEAGLPQRTLVGEATELGLSREEADVLALSLVEAGKSDTGLRAALRGVEEALQEGRLRAAEQLAAVLVRGADTEDALDRVQQATERVESLREAAGRALSQRPEEAAELLAQAVRIASDDEDLHQRLRSLPPPPPSDVRLSVERDHVLVRWQPSAARVGGVRYRVARGEQGTPVSVGQGSALTETEANEFADTHPPAGRPLSYSVFATRSGQIWSPTASAGPVVVTPDVRDLRVTATSSSVMGGWRLHDQAVDAVVWRALRPPRVPGDGQEVPAAKVQFVDRDVRPGVTYHYRVWAVYRAPDGSRSLSGGLVAEATPEAELTPVTDLQTVPDTAPSGAVFRFTWTPPEDDHAVSVHRRATRPAQRTGDVVSLAELDGLGELQGPPPPFLEDGRAVLSVPVRPGRWYFTAATLGHSSAVVGNTVQISLAAPVQGVVAERHGDDVQLGWIWPAGSAKAQIRWWPTGASPERGVETDCWKGFYEDRGGFRARVGPSAVTFTIQAVISQPEQEVASVPVSVDVPGLPPRVHYTLRRNRRRGRVTLTLAAEQSCTLPPLVVVQSQERVMPRNPAQGRVVGHVPAQPLRSDVPLSVELDVPPVPGRSWLLCFPEGSSGRQILLVAPPVSQLQAE